MSEKLWQCGSYELFVVSESPSKRLCLLRSINGQLLTFALQLPNLYPKNIFTSTSLFILLLFLFLFVLKWIFSCSVPTNPFNLRFCALNLLGLCILLLLSGTARDAGQGFEFTRFVVINSFASYDFYIFVVFDSFIVFGCSEKIRKCGTKAKNLEIFS